VLSPSHSTPRTSDTASTALIVPNARATTSSGWTRRHGNKHATPTVVTSEAPLHTSSLANVSIVAAPTTTATSNQSCRAGPGGFAARGSDQYGRLVSKTTGQAYGIRPSSGSAERTIRGTGRSDGAEVTGRPMWRRLTIRKMGHQRRTGMDTQIMITVSGLTKHYGDRIAVNEMSFDVAAGRVTGFVGPNGAGKSTTMRMMVGLTRPDHGDVRYHGVPYTRLLRPARIVGSVLDARCMHPGRTARNHLRATAALSAIPAHRIDEVLGEVGLESAADQRAGRFSLGMRQRLALAGALLGEPEVLLLDEPSNGLDPDGIRWLRNSLSAFAARGGTVFVSSHLIGELEMFADDLIVVGGGKLLAAETVSSTLARGRSTVVVRTPQAAELASLLHRRDISFDMSDDRLSIHGATTATVSQLAFDHQIRVVEIAEISRSLEEILLEMTSSVTEFASA
jgi:ABC-2 type transport system ATP-binding protein